MTKVPCPDFKKTPRAELFPNLTAPVMAESARLLKVKVLTPSLLPTTTDPSIETNPLELLTKVGLPFVLVLKSPSLPLAQEEP
jgi:hypothetical protein